VNPKKQKKPKPKKNKKNFLLIMCILAFGEMESDDDGVSMARSFLDMKRIANAVTLTPDPPAIMVKAGIPNPILNPTPGDNGFFTLASVIFHAEVEPERTHPGDAGVIETLPCPPGLRLISKNNLGCSNRISERFMDVMTCIMFNQIGASELIHAIGQLNKDGIANLKKKKNEVFEELCRSQPCDAELTKTKELFSGRCVKMMQHIDELTQAAQQECVAGATATATATATILASVIDLNDRCIQLHKSLCCSFDNLFKSAPSKCAASMDTSNFVRYGAKDSYLVGKNYSTTDAFPPWDEGTATPLDRFIHDHLIGHLHLAVGLRLGDQVRTVQVNINLRELKPQHLNEVVTLHEIVTLLMNTELKKRVVKLLCDKHQDLKLKAKGELVALAMTNWQVAVFDGGCTNIVGPSECPQILHMPTPNGNTSKRQKMEVLMGSSNPARGLAPGEEHIMPPLKTVGVGLKRARDYLPNSTPVHNFQASEFLKEDQPAPRPPSPPQYLASLLVDDERPLNRTLSTLSTTAEEGNTPKATLSSDSEGGKRTRRPRQPRRTTRRPRQPRRTTRRRSMRPRTRKSRIK
jgi:hypothetical protein